MNNQRERRLAMYELTVNITEVEPLQVGFTGVTVRVLFQGAD